MNAPQEKSNHLHKVFSHGYLIKMRVSEWQNHENGVSYVWLRWSLKWYQAQMSTPDGKCLVGDGIRTRDWFRLVSSCHQQPVVADVTWNVLYETGQARRCNTVQMTYTQVGQNSVFIDGFCRPFTLKRALYRLPFGLEAEPWSAGQRNRFYSYKMLHQI